MNYLKKPLLILAGPTAVGKTRLSIALAKATGGEIISADSMQVYKRMDIGSAKIRPREMEGVSHHLIDFLEPWEPFHVAAFQEQAKRCLTGIYERNHIPILVGGTGFYIQALLYDIDFTETREEDGYRQELEALLQEKGSAWLHRLLQQKDAEAASQIHENNHKRIIRALEFYHQTGGPISRHNQKEREKEAAYNACYFVLNEERHILYERIEKRVDDMLQAGLLEEVRMLRDEGCTRDMVSMQGLGYKELLDYLEGRLSYGEAVSLIKRDTRHFAKRQLTWFKRERDVIWLNKEEFGGDEGKILAFMLECAQKKDIIPAKQPDRRKDESI